MAGLSDVAGPSLEDQIRQRWGGYGDWKAGGQDQVAAFASLLRANGVDDLSKLQLKARNYTTAATRQMAGGDAQEEVETPGRSGTTFDVFYGDKQLNFLGDINRDGSVAAYRPQGLDVLTKGADGTWTTPKGDTQYSTLRGNDVANDMNLLAWSGAGRGNTSFTIQKGPDGQPVVVPVWGSSRQNTYNDARAIASMVGTAVGAYYAPQSSIASGALKGQGTAIAMSSLNPNGTPESTVNSGLGGLVTGGIGGGIKTIGAEYGWSPATTRAVTAGTNTLVRGGSLEDAGRNALTSGAQTWLNTDLGTNSVVANSGDNPLSEDNIVRFDEGGGGDGMGEEFDLTGGSGGGLEDVFDPRADENGIGDFSTTNTLPDNYFNEVNTTDPSTDDTGTGTYRPADNYGDGMSGEDTAAFDKALQDGTLPDWLKTATAGFKTVNDFLKSPIGKTLLGAGLLTTAVTGGKALSNPVDTTRYNALFDNLLSEQALASQRGKDLWADYTTIFKPAQQKFVDTAMNFDTAPRRESAAQDASGRVAASYDEQRMSAQREMERAGVDPSTIYALGVSSRLNQAKDEAAAENNARTDVEKTGLNLLKGVVDQGNQVVNQSTQQSNIVTGTGNSASGILNSQANAQNQNTQNRNGMISDLLTTGAMVYGMTDKPKTTTPDPNDVTSSKKSKDRGGKVDGLAAVKAVEKSPAEHWRYKPGQGDGSTQQRMGPMAEDLKKAAPQVSDGKKVDMIALVGLQHAAIGGLSKRLAGIEKKLGGLSDARRKAA